MNRTLIFIAFILTASFSHAQCVSGNCISGKGKYIQKDKSVYYGTFSRGQYNGKGNIKLPNGDEYNGDFIAGKKHGVGTYAFADGAVYTGDFINNNRAGRGRMKMRNGDQYKGEWRNGLFHGIGVYSFVNGDLYHGAFVDGELHGDGELTTSEGETIKGVWEHNALKAGTGTTAIASTHGTPPTTKDCTRLYCDNEQGSYYYSDGSVYTGYFVKGNPTGEGVCNYANGDVYKGGWKSHAPHGYGTMQTAKGEVIAGTFSFGQLIKREYTEGNKKKTTTSSPTSPVKKHTPTYNQGSKIYAVVVGVSTYNHMQSLKYTDDDAYQLYAFLKSPKGGAVPDENIKVLIDEAATTKQVLNAMESVFAKADADDVILLYLSGHGLEGYFVPYDFDGKQNLLSYKTILEQLDRSIAKNKLLITDACHSGSMYAAKGKLDDSLKEFYQQINQNNGGTALMTSSKSDEVSLEYSGMRQGIFSHFLIRGLKGEANKNGDKIVSLGELYDFVNTNVRNYTNQAQSPSLSGNYSREMPVGMIYDGY